MHGITQKIKKAAKDPTYAFCLILRKMLDSARARLAGGAGSALPPLSVFCYPTFACHFRCAFCWLWGEEGHGHRSPAAHMPPDRFEALLSGLPWMTREIVLLGGEPTLWPFFWEAVAAAKRRRRRVTCVTNGRFALPASPGDVLQLDGLNVVIDGPRALHDRIRGEGSFDACIGLLRQVEAIKQDHRALYPELSVTFTITPENALTLRDFLWELESYGLGLCAVRFQHVEFVRRQDVEALARLEASPKPAASFWQSFLQSPRLDPAALHAEIESVKKRKNRHPVSFHPDFDRGALEAYYRCETPFRGCAVIHHKARVMPDGQIWLCPGLSVGNISGQGLGGLWNGKTPQRVREWIGAGNSFPVCHRCSGNYG